MSEVRQLRGQHSLGRGVGSPWPLSLGLGEWRGLLLSWLLGRSVEHLFICCRRVHPSPLRLCPRHLGPAGGPAASSTRDYARIASHRGSTDSLLSCSGNKGLVEGLWYFLEGRIKVSATSVTRNVGTALCQERWGEILRHRLLCYSRAAFHDRWVSSCCCLLKSALHGALSFTSSPGHHGHLERHRCWYCQCQDRLGNPG